MKAHSPRPYPVPRVPLLLPLKTSGLEFWLLEVKIFSPIFNQEKFQNIVERNL